MLLETSPKHNKHHRGAVKEFRVCYVSEEPARVFEYTDFGGLLSSTNREGSSFRDPENTMTRGRVHHHDHVGKAKAKAVEEDVDEEAEEFIKFEHRKFNRWTTKG
ncbi:PREDICTED: uncharacterized protein LOC104825559 [Tarenaya hassleriana]|uniref:uncharacterized protein LOC104825559 n=1 Tax=Tarenaya hassleriana TaxID=28532 RepID=UPI00053C9334|nr:PREDICTED: uncharacterized protein LOC104825559 [Tarenaya hassleriana]